jgi:hypothetical protein
MEIIPQHISDDSQVTSLSKNFSVISKQAHFLAVGGSEFFRDARKISSFGT